MSAVLAIDREFALGLYMQGGEPSWVQCVWSARVDRGTLAARCDRVRAGRSRTEAPLIRHEDDRRPTAPTAERPPIAGAPGGPPPHIEPPPAVTSSDVEPHPVRSPPPEPALPPLDPDGATASWRSEEHTSELQSP